VATKLQLNISYHIISHIITYETGEWLKDFKEITMIALKKKPQATKCSDHHTISLTAHSAKIVAKIPTSNKFITVSKRIPFNWQKSV